MWRQILVGAFCALIGLGVGLLFGLGDTKAPPTPWAPFSTAK